MNHIRFGAALARLLVLGMSIMSLRDVDAAPAPLIGPQYKVRIERNILITTRDGTRLAADLIRPDAHGRFPAIIEYIPYRKDDLARGGFDAHTYFAERGFIGVRLDVRGTGGSEGINTDEYMPIEQQDGFDAVEWCADQPWSNGAVGMFGTSYGGFTCIQVAMHRPPHLKAIVPMYATDDRYTDDCHYTPGGNMRMYYDVGTYGGSMVSMNALPPYPELAGSDWADLWRTRLEKNEPYILTWMKNQVDGPYWRGASLRPGYDRINCPVFLIGGWRDGYASTMLRTFANLTAPKKLLMGPWVHQRPNTSVPGPRINYLNEVVRFFAEHLRGDKTGIMQEPPVTVYMQEYARPERTLDVTPGRWRSEPGFPAAGTKDLELYLGEDGRLAKVPSANPRAPYDEFEYYPAVGTANGYWSAGGMTFYLAEDQRTDEAWSLVWTTTPFDEDLPVLGWPRVVLHGSSSAPVATFVARLCDVAPDGSSAQIVDGSLNITRRNSLSEPEPAEPDKVYELGIPMNPTGWVIARGHRLRLSVSGADFPNLWPTPERARQRVFRDALHASRVILPTVPPAKLATPEFHPPPSLPPIMKSYAKPPRQEVLRDQITGAVTIINETGSTVVLPDNLGELSGRHTFRCTASSRDPSQSSIVGTHTNILKREDGEIEVTAESTIRATATAFHILINLTVTRNGKPFFQRQWTATEPRRML
jgi:putative CocE/NonD family hydrolase